MQRFVSKRKLIISGLTVLAVLAAAAVLIRAGAVDVGPLAGKHGGAGNNSAQNTGQSTANGATATGKSSGSNGAGNPSVTGEGGTSVTNSSSAVTPAPATTAPASQTISITGGGFSPASLTVRKGTPVAWVNKDSATHALDRADGAELGPHSPQLGSGQSFTYSYARAGTYKYVCVIHPSMTGTVTVTD